jgi:hypothetical protein
MQVTILILVLMMVAIPAGFFSYMHINNLRNAKNYERGLKMVTMQIHLPPPSEDLETGSRDSRDINEESINKSQVMYNILSSISTKGVKSKLYGQKHIAFEIIASKGVIKYYAIVPYPLIPLVDQAVTSAYPSARLEEVEQHNIFSKVGKTTGTIGGEFQLKKSYAYPIATYRETKRDVMQSILNSMVSLGHEDGVALQFIIRPARQGWSKSVIKLTDKIKKNKGKKTGAASILPGLSDISAAAWKVPEGSEGKNPEAKQLSSLEQTKIEAMEEKTRHPGYEVKIRAVASSNTAMRSQTILNNLVSSFTLFDAHDRNGLKFSVTSDIESFITSYILRIFPQKDSNVVLNSVELATLFHLPDQRIVPTSQLERQTSKQVDGPSNVPETGLFLGYNVYRGTKKEIRLSEKDRGRHMYIVGQTGTGKSVLLGNLALQDMLDGRGFAFIDPHGDVAEELMAMVPKERTEDVIYFNPGDMDYPLGLNLFEFQREEDKDFLIQEAINMLYKLYDPQHQGIIGPRYESWFRNAALTLMSDPGGSTFIDVPKVFTDNDYAMQKKKYVKDETVLDFWNKEMASTSDYHKSEMLGWFVSKFGAFLNNEMMRNIIGQTKSSFNLRDVMDNGKILIANLSKGRLGDMNAKLLGMMFVMKFQAAAMARADTPEDQRRPFTLYVDEFQNFSTDSFSEILSEARKYKLSLIVANQYVSQLSDEIRDAVFGNVGSIIALRASANDADMLVKYFSPVFETEDIVKMPNYNAAVQMLINGVPTKPFSMATAPPLGKPNPKLGEAMKKLSAAKYGKPRDTVSKEIFARLRTENPSGAKPSPNGRSVGPGAKPAQPQKPNSFLDDWLSKRKNGPSASPTAQSTSPGALQPISRPHAPTTPPSVTDTFIKSRPTAPQQAQPAYSAQHTAQQPVSLNSQPISAAPQVPQAPNLSNTNSGIPTTPVTPPTLAVPSSQQQPPRAQPAPKTDNHLDLSSDSNQEVELKL